MGLLDYLLQPQQRRRPPPGMMNMGAQGAAFGFVPQDRRAALDWRQDRLPPDGGLPTPWQMTITRPRPYSNGPPDNQQQPPQDGLEDTGLPGFNNLGAGMNLGGQQQPPPNITTSGILDRAGQPPPTPEQQPPTPGPPGAGAMFPPQAQEEQPGFLQRAMNPTTLMGLSVLGAPHNNWGQGIAQGAQAGAALTRNQMMERELQNRQQRERIWRTAFPNGQPDMNHPLLRGVPPELIATAFAMGPDQGLQQLGQLAMTRSTQQLQIEQRQQIMQLLSRMMQGGQGGQQPPTGGQPGQPPPTGGAANLTGAVETGLGNTGIPGMAGAGLGVIPPSAPQPPPTGGQPPPTGGQPPPMDMASVFNDPTVMAAMAGSIMAGDMTGAMTALEQAGRQYRGVQLAGPQRLAERQAEQQATDQNRSQSAQRMWRLVDDLERSSAALGNGRLANALSPTGSHNIPIAGRMMNREAFNDQQLLMTHIANMIVEARETQRGLGPLANYEQQALERAYAGMQSATDPASFQRHLDTIRYILRSRVPGQENYVPRWMQQGEAAQAGQGQGQGQAQPPPRTPPPMTPPPPGSGTRTDSFSAGQEGHRVFDSQTGLWGTVRNGRFVSDRNANSLHLGRQ